MSNPRTLTTHDPLLRLEHMEWAETWRSTDHQTDKCHEPITAEHQLPMISKTLGPETRSCCCYLIKDGWRFSMFEVRVLYDVGVWGYLNTCLRCIWCSTHMKVDLGFYRFNQKNIFYKVNVISLTGELSCFWLFYIKYPLKTCRRRCRPHLLWVQMLLQACAYHQEVHVSGPNHKTNQ